MIQLPDFLLPFKDKAKEYISKACVRDIEFSGGTYQVQLIDPDTQKKEWAFLQLDQRGNIKDCFCSCEKAEDLDYCEHIAAAFLSIYNDQSYPLHQRFEYSLWNQLCKLFAERLGDDPDILQHVKEGEYIHKSIGGKIIFSIYAKNPDAISKLHKILWEREKETEETSLKFSNLPQDEIDLWRAGTPSSQLRYELSYWNDLAHWLTLMQERHVPYSIKFDYSEDRIPNQINISFTELDISFYLAIANLPLIIPALESVKSPLKVHRTSLNAIESISYDKINDALLIKTKLETSKPNAGERSAKKSGVQINGWQYVPGDGFFARDPHQLLTSTKLTGSQLAEALNEHARVIKPLLQNASLYLTPISISYSLAFDPDWNLHITGYAFTPGDLNAPYSRFFGDWIYLNDDGFYPISESHFKSLETVIPASEISDFVRQERSWLNTQDGFHAHLTSIEAQLIYTVSSQNKLSFSRSITTPSQDKESKDLGAWVYITGKGFYAKASNLTTLPIHSDIAINADQIPLFIRMNRSELQLVPDFFSKKCPISKTGLKIELNDHISISPVYEMLPEYQDKDVRFFDDFIYTSGEGFYELPADTRLPERFHHAVIIEHNDIDLFINYELDQLKPYAIQIDPRLIPPMTRKLTAQNIERSNSGEYLLKLVYETENGPIPFATIWTGVKQKNRFLFTEKGLFDLSEGQFDWIRHIPKNRLDKRNNILQLTILELIRLNALEELIVAGDAKSKGLLRELTEFHIPSEPNLSNFKSNLRPYQQIGTHWLWFLYTHGLSGLLCDDMGLGKTHQSMGLLAGIYNLYTQIISESTSSAKPLFLIVCPTSVLFHWQEKIEEFLPNFRVCMFYGTSRTLENIKDYDIILTSYGIWRIDNESLKEFFFEVAIFDEIQIAKNQQSRINLALRNINSRMRLGLTGTPIENHLRELKSLFDIVLPNYMPNDKEYREIFVKPIEKGNDPGKKALLTRFIKPFVLRRKKEEVLTDLPEKTEEISHCFLLPSQQILYNQVLQQSREQILNQMSDQDSPIPYIHIFALLSSLKQICNHPASFLKIPEDYTSYESGKWELFIELLLEARESSQKVVIFSQYLNMLDIFEDYLNENSIGFATIRGATINRGEQVHRFNHDPACEVFLGSLQASGLGVDLTAGSVVIHYDRWWNAARENQATDRVHRFGQTRGVQVFKLVTKGTFEERIDDLITKKAKLMEDVISSDDHRFLKKFSREDILQLLKDVGETR